MNTLEPPGNSTGGTSEVGYTTFHKASALRSARPVQHEREQQTVTMIGHPNLQSNATVEESSMRQTVMGLNSLASDLRHDQFQNIFPSQQHFHSMPQQMPNPMMYVQRYPNIANANPLMHQQYQVQQHLQQFNQPQTLNLGLRAPQIQLSQRQIELLQARNQQQQKLPSTSALHQGHSLIPQTDTNIQVQHPILLTRNNIAMQNSLTTKLDPPDKTTAKGMSRSGPRDPPTAASVVMSTISDASDTGNEQRNKTKSDSGVSSQTQNSEQQRKFLRSLLQKAGTQSIASSGTGNKAGKDLVKKVLQKGASNLTGSKAKYALHKTNNTSTKKAIQAQGKDMKSNGNANHASLRDRWFKRKGVQTSLVDSVTLTWTSSSSTKEYNDCVSPLAEHQVDPISESRSPRSAIHSDMNEEAEVETDISPFDENMTIQRKSERSKDQNDSFAAEKVVLITVAQDSEQSKNVNTKDGSDLINSRDMHPPVNIQEHYQPHSMETMANTKHNPRSDEDIERGFEHFMEALQQEVFSGQFTHLWTTFSALLMDNEEAVNLIDRYKDAKPFKVDQHTKQILKELNHHAKRYNNVECLPRSQVLNDKNFFQEFPDKKFELLDRGGRNDSSEKLILASESGFFEETPKGIGDTSKSVLQVALNTKPSSLEEHRNMKPLSDSLTPSNHSRCSTKSKPSLQINTSCIDSENDATNSSTRKSAEEGSATFTGEKDTEKQTGKEVNQGWPRAPASSLSAIPWLERRENLRSTESSKTGSQTSRIRNDDTESKESPAWAGITLRPESNHQTFPKTNQEPAWTKVTLRRVDNGSRDGESARSNEIPTAMTDTKRIVSGVVPDGTKENHPVIDLTEFDEKDYRDLNKKYPDHKKNKTKPFLAHETNDEFLIDGGIASKPNGVVIIRLAEEPEDGEESRVIVGKTLLMRVQSTPGEAKALVRWKLPRLDVESITLDMAKKQVNLLLHANRRKSDNSFILRFETEEDCLKFANAYYAMQTKDANDSSDNTISTAQVSDESIEQSNISFFDALDSSTRLESLTDEEQNVLETYRRLRQTKAPKEALNESLVKNKSAFESLAKSLNVDGSKIQNKLIEMQLRKDTERNEKNTDGVHESSKALPEYVIPPDLPSSPVSTFSNSVCTVVTAEDEIVAEKYRKMLRLKVPFEAVRHKMLADNVDPKVVAIVLGNQNNSSSDEDSQDTSKISELVEKYKKMLKLGLPEDAVRHKMKQDQHLSKRICELVFGITDNAKQLKSKLTESEEQILSKYRNFVRIGMPKEAVQHKMRQDNIEQKLINFLFGDEPTQSTMSDANGTSNDEKSTQQMLSDEEETVASQYRKMLKLQIPKDAVLARMEKEGINQNIISAVIRDPALIAKSKSRKDGNNIQGNHSSSMSTGSNLINFHWNVLSGPALPGSVWDKVSASEVNNGDVSELIELFQKKSKSSNRRASRISDDSSVSGHSKVKLLDITRSNNIAISLKAFKEFSYRELADIIAFVDPLRKIHGERSQFIRDLLPTAQEIRIIEDFTGPDERLVPAERWFRHLIGIERLETKVHVIRTMEMFCSEVETARSNFNLLYRVCRQVMDSQRLQVLLQAVLGIGNKLNEGTRNGDAIGFRFDSLLRLTQTKAADGKTTALDYLVKEFAEKGQRTTLILIEDFPECLTASRMLLSDMTNEVNNLQKALEECKVELYALKRELQTAESKVSGTSTSGKTMEVVQQIESAIGKRHSSPLKETDTLNSLAGGVSRLSSFIDSVVESITCLKSEKESALQACNDLARYSGEPGGISSTTGVLAILAEFATTIEIALKKYDENQRTAARKQKTQEAKDLSASKVDSMQKQSNGNEKSLVLLVNDILKNANPQFKEDFKKGRFVHNPSESLMVIYEHERKLKVSDVPLSTNDTTDKLRSEVSNFKTRAIEIEARHVSEKNDFKTSEMSTVDERVSVASESHHKQLRGNSNKQSETYLTTSKVVEEKGQSSQIDTSPARGVRMFNLKPREVQSDLSMYSLLSEETPRTPISSEPNVHIPKNHNSSAKNESEDPSIIADSSDNCDEEEMRLLLTTVDSFRENSNGLNLSNDIEDCNSSVMDNSMKHEAVRKYLDLALNQHRNNIITTPRVRPSAVINTSIGRLLDPDEEDCSEAFSVSNDKLGSGSISTSSSAADRMKSMRNDAHKHCNEHDEEYHQTSTGDKNDVIFDLSSSEKRLLVKGPSTLVGKEGLISDAVKMIEGSAEIHGEKTFHTPPSIKTNSDLRTSKSKDESPVCANSISAHETGVDSEVNVNKESHVAKMARLKREEKNRTVRKSSPIPPKGHSLILSGAQVSSNTQSPVTPQIQKTHLSQVDPFTAKPSESAMSKLARQKRISKRLTR